MILMDNRGQKNVLFRLFFAVFLFAAITGPEPAAQDAVLYVYQRQFDNVGLPDKAGILRDAAGDSRAPEFIGHFYDYVLNYSLHGDVENLQRNPDMINLVRLSIQGILKSGYQLNTETLLEVFLSYRDTETRLHVLDAMVVSGKGDPRIPEALSTFLADQNNLRRTGTDINYITFSAGLSALASLTPPGEKAYFSLLLAIITTDYPNNIIAEAEKAVRSIGGDYYQFLIDILRKSPVREKLTAFRAGTDTGKYSWAKQFSAAQRGNFAETALEVSIYLHPVTAEDKAALAALQSEAIIILKDMKWSRAEPLVIKYFYRMQTEFQNESVPGERFLEAITCLGAMGTVEAAQILALQLGYFNSIMERTGDFDESLTLVLVNALGEIGAKSGFDYLRYVSHLAYPENIQNAARVALGQLKW
ncbi:hypothetical protein FACS189442_1000 [Spirochaetia bacterium]|nr:hypothetical protein FACS189442_1000 [Spirochaetia bacterium]